MQGRRSWGSERAPRIAQKGANKKVSHELHTDQAIVAVARFVAAALMLLLMSPEVARAELLPSQAVHGPHRRQRAADARRRRRRRGR